MISEEHQAFIEQALSVYRADESPDESLVLADYFTERGDLRHAATALDRAYGLNPDDTYVADRRQKLLDEFEIVEHGIRFRYVPAGTYLMGSETGDHDEKPAHPVRLDEYWVSETTVTWSTYSDICGHQQPPERSSITSGYSQRISTSSSWGWAENRMAEENEKKFLKEIYEPNMKLQCTVNGAQDFPKRLLQFDAKPMVSVTQEHIDEFLMNLSTSGVNYDLPTEQQWEKAARGGRINQLYPWGNSLPDSENCDFGVYANFDVMPSKTFPPNSYGLYAMSGGVWEWTKDKYDSKAYYEEDEPPQSLLSKTLRRKKKPNQVLFRGGSWADCADAVTVSFRMSAETSGDNMQSQSPTFGFRIFRTTR